MTGNINWIKMEGSQQAENAGEPPGFPETIKFPSDQSFSKRVHRGCDTVQIEK